MNWDLLDVLTFGGMIAAAVIMVLLARRRSGNRAFRIAATVATAGAFLLVWANGAVGIIGSEEN